MTSIPNALIGTREDAAELSITTDALQPAAASTTRLQPETVMVILLAVWMLIGGVICGFTALSY
ncbi:MAG: hypothetical protein JO187_04825 [Acidobacteria bacterium]|nr:hypothetical protein [Acidobacteriaceae bacterium]MBV9608859.1 hypothetical protein [Acidobacteriota bacterium]